MNVPQQLHTWLLYCVVYLFAEKLYCGKFEKLALLEINFNETEMEIIIISSSVAVQESVLTSFMQNKECN